jgi:hypothetical protein
MSYDFVDLLRATLDEMGLTVPGAAAWDSRLPVRLDLDGRPALIITRTPDEDGGDDEVTLSAQFDAAGIDLGGTVSRLFSAQKAFAGKSLFSTGPALTPYPDTQDGLMLAGTLAPSALDSRAAFATALRQFLDQQDIVLSALT